MQLKTKSITVQKSFVILHWCFFLRFSNIFLFSLHFKIKIGCVIYSFSITFFETQFFIYHKKNYLYVPNIFLTSLKMNKCQRVLLFDTQYSKVAFMKKIVQTLFLNHQNISVKLNIGLSLDQTPWHAVVLLT